VGKFFTGGGNICDTLDGRYAEDATENREMYLISVVFNAPVEGDPVGISQRCLVLEKLQ